MRRLVAATLAALLPLPAGAVVLGGDAAVCEAGKPAILATVQGLKARDGIVKLELYPPSDPDFTSDDRDLVAQGKTFRRVSVPTPAGGPVQLCIRVPAPGRYALLFTHNRSGRNKFDYKNDGAAIPSNKRIGYAKPKAAAAIVDVGAGVRPVAMRAQYFSLFGGFSPRSGD